jgi:predicted ATPase
MIIRKLDIEGFRSLRNVSWKPNRLNVVIGPNGTGKSNLLRFLEMISTSAHGRLRDFVKDSGGMDPLVWDGQASSITFTLTTDPFGSPTGPEQYELEMSRLGLTSSYRINRELLANYIRVKAGETSQPFKYLERGKGFPVVFDENDRKFTAPPESIAEDETLLSIAAGPFINNHLISEFQKWLAGISVYHDFHVNRDAEIRKPVVASMEKRVDPDGQNLIQVMHTLYTTDRDFKNNINDAMRAAFGSDFEELVFPPAADQRIQLRIRWRPLKREQSAADLSDGTLRFLFLLTVLASPSPAPVIAIDEPETGLHPSMLSIIAEYAVEASMRSQVIFTTHSPQFLDAFKDKIPTTTITKWSDGETKLETLKDDELRYWLKSYSLGTLFETGELEAMK